MTGTLTMGIDAGSHGVRVVVLALDGSVLAQSSVPYSGPLPPARRPFTAYTRALHLALEGIPATTRAGIGALAVTGVRGSIVGFEDDDIVTEVVPDFDHDSIPFAEHLRERYGETLSSRTGCPAFVLSGLPKMMRLQVEARVWVSLQDAVVWWLTGVLACSAGSALRLGVLTRDGAGYDESLLTEVGLRQGALAPIVPIGAVVEEVAGPVGAVLGLTGAAVVAAPGDAPAALCAIGALDWSTALAVLSTSTVVSVPVATSAPVPPACTLELLPDGRRSLETGDGSGMLAADWAARLLGVSAHSLDVLAAGADDVGPVRFVPPAFDLWGCDGAASLTGMTSGFGPAELAAVTLHAVADGATRAIARLRETTDVRRVIAAGGGARSDSVVSRIASLTALPVSVSPISELSAYGAAVVARSAA